MFFLKDLEHEVSLPPRFFGPGLLTILNTKLHADVEGTCDGRYGYIVNVVGVERASQGVIQDTFGCATFKMRYKAIVLKPFKGEVVDALVTTVNKMGFFAHVGPLQIFVSTHHIADMTFDATANPPCFASEDQSLRLGKGDHVRLRIIGTRVDATEIFAIGTIKEDYLGVV